MADIHPGNEPGNAVRPAAPHAANGHGPLNPTVRFEPTDVTPRTVLVFVGAVAGLVIVLGVFLVGLFFLLENREKDKGKSDMPFAAMGRNAPPVSEGEIAPQGVEMQRGVPQIEGILPGREVGRTWANHMEADGPPYWLGYNVRLVEPPEDEPKAANPAEQRLEARAALEKEVRKVDEAIGQVAGKLPARKGAAGAPADRWRQSWGDGASGRNVPPPQGEAKGDKEQPPAGKGEQGKGGGDK